MATLVLGAAGAAIGGSIDGAILGVSAATIGRSDAEGGPGCQRRSKIGPRGGAKLGHFGFARDACDGRRPVSRALHVAGG
jgi:hypothetical protein